MMSHNAAPLDRQGFQLGDQVVVRANTVKMAVGTVGTIVGFSAIADHPLVEISRRGRFLIPALSLVRWMPLPGQTLPSA
jgi:hypothetical protein